MLVDMPDAVNHLLIISHFESRELVEKCILFMCPYEETSFVQEAREHRKILIVIKFLIIRKPYLFILNFMFSLRLLQRFADYRYFREIADFMKIKVPLLNQEILLDNNRSCLVHGLKII